MSAWSPEGFSKHSTYMGRVEVTCYLKAAEMSMFFAAASHKWHRGNEVNGGELQGKANKGHLSIHLSGEKQRASPSAEPACYYRSRLQSFGVTKLCVCTGCS